MTERELEKKIKKKFSDINLVFYKKRRWYCDIPKDKIREVAEFLFNELGCRFSTASGIDTPKGFEIIYHFSHDKTGIVVSLRVVVSKDDPWTYSLTPIAPVFEWIEREIHELLGVDFEGLPCKEHLLLPEDTPFDYNPLRRDHG